MLSCLTQRKESNTQGQQNENLIIFLYQLKHPGFFLALKNCLAGHRGLAGCPVVDGITLLQRRAEEEEE